MLIVFLLKATECLVVGISGQRLYTQPPPTLRAPTCSRPPEPSPRTHGGDNKCDRRLIARNRCNDVLLALHFQLTSIRKNGFLGTKIIGKKKNTNRLQK
ncbi:hypothetical protein CEXT_729141 [Caerostris extrusa]|uniref:Secreted protein n=1 Tax=Caerostris extrusa TaxID=172846 RepID=A0AAV4PH19_CAEEX|nr:hypothetical protein CEXT_729141 [Caerostris extrusa]